LNVLLTGASGFVGSHILDRLCAQAASVNILLRATSDTRFIRPHLPQVQVRSGSLNEPATLEKALAGITHVIHCAGCTKARRNSEFYEVNHLGTRNLVAAINAQSPSVQRLVHISSLAAAGPATPALPAREEDQPRPVSEYGASKLAAELEVRAHCRSNYFILRPPAVYGPRDDGFLPIFRAVSHHLLPSPSRKQSLSLVYAKDLAEAVVTCLEHPTAARKTYFVASSETVTGRLMAEEIAAQMRKWTVPCPLPFPVLWVACLTQQLRSKMTGQASLLSLQKYAELRALGWVCDASLLRKEVGFECRTGLKSGIHETLNWYQENNWLQTGARANS
jgi:nucleoside-diphosphate-sugar epimerase